MSKIPWSAPTTSDEAHRRAAGRRRYNSIRTMEKLLRRNQVLAYLDTYGLHHGIQARIARALGVSEATISRDVAALLFDVHYCPTCRRVLERSEWEELEAEGHVRLNEKGVEAA